MGLTKSVKYQGVYFNNLKNGDKTYYITYKDLTTNKKIYLKVGTKNSGITEKFCYNKKNEILTKMRLGEEANPIRNRRIRKRITSVDMIAKRYYENRKLHMSEKNYKDALSLYITHIQPYIGNKDINEVSEDDIENIMVDKKTKLANKTINSIIQKVSTIFNFAIKKKLFKGSNPAKYIEKLPESNERTRFLSSEEISLLLDEVKYDTALYLFTYIALTTGGRLESLCALKIQDIDFRHNVVNIIDTKNKTNYRGFLKDDPNFINLLKEHIKGRPVNEHIFKNKSTIAIKRDIQRNLSKVFNKLFNKSINESPKSEDKELEAEKRRNKVVVHTLRHTFASQLAINGTPIFTIQKLMNHKDIKQTLRYAKLGKDGGRDFVNNLF